VPQAQGIIQHVGNTGPKAIQPGQCIFAHGNQNIRVNLLPIDRQGEFGIECVVFFVFRMIKKIFLELVEDNQERAFKSLCCREQKLIQRQIGVELVIDISCQRGNSCQALGF